MIPILPSAAWREFRGTPNQKGLNQTTHLASIATPSGKVHKCYVKLTPPNWPTPLTEALAWLLAEALELPRPEFAALVMVPISKLKDHMPLDQHWLQYPEAIAFCSSAVDGQNPVRGWKWVAEIRKKRLYRRPEVARIGAFDQWVENQDRHLGNLLVRKSGEHVPIDNELILYSLLWPSVGLNFNHNSLVNEAKRQLTDTDFKQFAVEVARCADRHHDALLQVGPRLQAMIDALVADKNTAKILWQQVSSFLHLRAARDWLPQQLGVIT